MKLTSLDGSMTLAVAARGMGFALTLDGHVWLFDRNSRITGSIPPDVTAEEIAEGVPRHRVASSPEGCPGCRPFVRLNER
jgi:hypothetical protein